MKNNKWIIAITGASGVRYAMRLLTVLQELGKELHVVVSESAIRVFNEEENITCSQSELHKFLNNLSDNDSGEKNIFRENKVKKQEIKFYNFKDIGASIASGSFITEGMVVVPCSMGTLGALTAGLSQNLIHRAAEVTLKEGRKLILVPRETPLSTIHLENMTKLSRLGVRIVPAMPGFYHQPKTIEELIDMQVMKILDVMGVDNELVKRWKYGAPSS